MFVKPLLVSLQDSTASSRAVYRQVVIQNMVCTVGIAVTYAITTAVVVVAVTMANASPEGSKVRSFLVNICPGHYFVYTPTRKKEATKLEERPSTVQSLSMQWLVHIFE